MPVPPSPRLPRSPSRRRPHPPDVAQRRLRGAADPLGRGDGRRARAGDRDHHQARAPQRDRHAQRLVQRVPRAGGGRGRADRGAQGRPHQHRAHRRHRPVSRSGASPARSSAMDPWGAMVADVFARRDGRRLRHPADHRGDQGAHRSCPRSSRRSQTGRLRRRRPHPAAPTARRWSPRPRSSRSGTCPAWRSDSAAARPICAARCSRRPAACTPSSSRAATSRCSCRRSAARPSTSSATSAGPRRSRGRADRARARRVQRLGRVRLRHLHLPAVPDARDRGVHPGRAARRRRPRRLLAARRAARSAR